MSDELTGEWAMVTGATSNLGLTIAMALARAGAAVVVHGKLDPDHTVQRVRAEVPGSRVEGVAFDLAEPEAIREGFADLSARGIQLSILVNNAAHLGLDEVAPLADGSTGLHEVLAVNVHGTYLCSLLAAQQMARRDGGGSIINISSLAGQRAIPQRLAYNTSKAAINGMSRSMAVDLAKHRVRVNAVAPGYVWSDRWEAIAPEESARRRARIPVAEPTKQSEIAHMVVFLASPKAPTLTGTVLVIDGGLEAQQHPAEAETLTEALSPVNVGSLDG